MTNTIVPALLTTGAIADLVGEPIHRVEYVLRTRNIRPVGIAGRLRVYDTDAVDQIEDALRDIDEARDQREARRVYRAARSPDAV